MVVVGVKSNVPAPLPIDCFIPKENPQDEETKLD